MPRGREWDGWRDGEKLFFDRLRGKRVGVLEANKMGYLESGIGGMGRKLIGLNAKYDDNALIKMSFFDYEWDRCTWASACCGNQPKNGKYPP